MRWNFTKIKVTKYYENTLNSIKIQLLPSEIVKMKF